MVGGDKLRDERFPQDVSIVSVCVGGGGLIIPPPLPTSAYSKVQGKFSLTCGYA